MSRAFPNAGVVVGAALALSLSACVTLLPKQPPAHLYRFGASPTGGAMGNIPDLIVRLPAASEGDGILAITGNQAAYIAGARWVSPAVILFREAATQALTPPLSAAPKPERLTIEVVRFEADYDHGEGAAPTVRVEALAAITDDLGHERPLGRFAAARGATDNRVGAIVTAFDGAVSEVLNTLAAKVAQTPPKP